MNRSACSPLGSVPDATKLGPPCKCKLFTTPVMLVPAATSKRISFPSAIIGSDADRWNTCSFGTGFEPPVAEFCGDDPPSVSTDAIALWPDRFTKPNAPAGHTHQSTNNLTRREFMIELLALNVSINQCAPKRGCATEGERTNWVKLNYIQKKTFLTLIKVALKNFK